MKEVSRFIPMDGNGEQQDNTTINEIGNVGGVSEQNNGGVGTTGASFKVCGNNGGSNLPVKASFWSRLKGVLTYQVKVELTPYEQKIEDEINEFLHQEVTWQSFKNFLFQDVTFGKKAN